MKQQDKKPVVGVRPYSYQPSKAELEADISIDLSPEEIRDALLRAVTVKTIPGPTEAPS